jgi:hypothetical protein
MSTTKIRAKNDVTAGYQQVITGLNTYLANRTLNLNGKPVTSKAAVAIIQQQIVAMQASTAAHTAWLQSVAKERAASTATVAPLLAALRHYVAAVFGPTSDEYLAFGFPPPKARTKSPVAKVIGAEKLRATRKARNTMGSKQRLQVIGTVPSAITLAVGITPSAAAAPAPAQPVAPASGAAPAQPTETVTVTTPTTGGAATK